MRTVSYWDTAAGMWVAEEDSLEEEHGPRAKRFRSSLASSDQLSAGNNEVPIPPSQYNPLDEPSPLGLRLRKSPSLLDLIQMQLSQHNASRVDKPSQNQSNRSKKDTKATATASTTDKLKASNFSGSLLKIGSWEYVSRYEGDLVAKCYFAKHKLVWEILQTGLKSKIEIQWSDIVALKADCPNEGPGSLTITLSRKPLFYRETNPQPRKHTLWQASGDFTDGHASKYRQHFLQCAPGVLNKHYEKLIQCDARLKFLSQQPELSVDPPCFEAQAFVSKNSDELKVHALNQLGSLNSSMVASFQEAASTSAASSSSLNSEQQNPTAGASECGSAEAPSPSSVIDSCTTEGSAKPEVYNFPGLTNWEQLKMPGMPSASGLMNHTGNCITDQVTSRSLSGKKASECQEMLENISQILLSDTHCTAASDEKSLMKKVNSLCCLLQETPPPPNSQTHAGENHLERLSNAREAESNFPLGGSTQENGSNNVNNPASEDILATSIPRNDSFGDFLLRLPRIASVSNFLFDIPEADENQGR